MKNSSNDLYLLQDGTYASPGDCKAGKDGILRHKNGLAVAMREDGTEPMTVASNAIENKNVEAAKIGKSELAPADANQAAVDMTAMATTNEPSADDKSADKVKAA